MDLLGNIANLKVDTVLSAVDKYVPGAQNKIKNLADKAKAYVNNVSELELKVLEATNHDPWGPHGSVMQEITNSSFNSEGFYQIMGVADQRLSEPPENWRLVYKTLLLLEFMVKHGPLSVAEALVSYSRLSHLERLRDRFEFKEASGRDQGINVRQRAGALVALLQDRDKLNEERDKAAKNKAKYTGVSSSSMRYGGFGSGSSSDFPSGRSNYDSYSGGGSNSFQRSTSASSYGAARGSSGGFGSSSNSYSAAADGTTTSGSNRPTSPTDPVEATRQRIARLKAEGTLPSAAAAAEADGSSVGPGLEGSADGLSPKKPKKLSEIKINPAISATFAKGGLAPPPGSGSGARRVSGTAASSAAGSGGFDLLGDLDVPAAAPAAPAASSSSQAQTDDWAGFASAPAAPTAAAANGSSDEWAAFDSAPAVGSKQQQQKGAIDINALLGAAASTPTPAAAAGGSKAPLPLDDFCSVPMAAPAAAAAPAHPAAAGAAPTVQQQATFDPFAAAPPVGSSSGISGSAHAPAAAADPFAASAAVHMAASAGGKHHGAESAGPKLGPETAKAKDPFADLAFL